MLIIALNCAAIPAADISVRQQCPGATGGRRRPEAGAGRHDDRSLWIYGGHM